MPNIIRPPMRVRFMFSYGPDTDPGIAALRVPDPVFVTTARMDSRRFQIDSDGRATMVPRRNHTVWGVIWAVPEPGMGCLDLQLGVPTIYERYGGMARNPDGRLIQMEFHATRNLRPGKASSEYLDPIIDAALRWGFPLKYVEHIQGWSK